MWWWRDDWQNNVLKDRFGICFVVLGTESGDIHVLGKCSTIKQLPKCFKMNCYKMMKDEVSFPGAARTPYVLLKC